MKRKRIASILPYLKGSYGLSLACLLFATLSVGAKMAIPFLTGMAIAQDGIAVVVNPSNSLSNIEMTMICNIYIGQITTWEQVKGESAE